MTIPSLKGCIGLAVACLALTSCTRMAEQQDVFLVANEPVPVFTTKELPIGPSADHTLAVLAPKQRVPVLDCADVKDYPVYKIRLPDGRMGFVNEGHYTLQDKDGRAAPCGQAPEPRTPEPQRGWVTNCIGPDFSKFAKGGAAGPGPARPVFRINDHLVLGVPKENWPLSGSLSHEPPTCTKISDLPPLGFVQFYIQGNWSSGYKPSDVPFQDGTPASPQVQPDKVWVRIEREPESTLSAKEQLGIEDMRRKARQEQAQGAREIAGLLCNVYCWADGLGDSDRVALKYIQRNPFFVEIYAGYRSHRYGGVLIWWKTVTSDLSHWRAIDGEVWKVIGDWDLSDNAPNEPHVSESGRAQ